MNESARRLLVIITINALLVLTVPSLILSQEKGAKPAPQAAAAAVDTAEKLKGKPASDEVPMAPDAEKEKGEKPSASDTAWVVFHGKKLYQVGAISKISAAKRASILSVRLKRLAETPLVRTDKFLIKEDDDLGVSLIFTGLISLPQSGNRTQN